VPVLRLTKALEHRWHDLSSFRPALAGRDTLSPDAMILITRVRRETMKGYSPECVEG
jgi:hypothetical protein